MNKDENGISKLLDELYPDVTLLTEEQVRQLMKEHSRLEGSQRKAAKATEVSSSYWQNAARGRQPIGKKVADGYELEEVRMYRRKIG